MRAERCCLCPFLLSLSWRQIKLTISWTARQQRGAGYVLFECHASVHSCVKEAGWYDYTEEAARIVEDVYAEWVRWERYSITSTLFVTTTMRARIVVLHIFLSSFSQHLHSPYNAHRYVSSETPQTQHNGLLGHYNGHLSTQSRHLFAIGRPHSL